MRKPKLKLKRFLAYIFKQILILLHPFIPFVTEEIWLKNKFDKSGKNFLMLQIGHLDKQKKINTKQVEKIIGIISELRSFKNELNVGPGSFIEMSINNISKSQNLSLLDNEIILKKLGRISNIHQKIMINQQLQ